LKIVTCVLKQSAGNVATQPKISVWVGLESLIDAVDAVAGFLDLEMLALEESNTGARQSAFEQLYRGRDAQQDCKWYTIKP
jgi:hypothetical protein